MMKKKLYITTAIPYANGAPHIGNALDYLIADIWARYQRQQGNEVRFQVGTDEHGNKIAEKAAENAQALYGLKSVDVFVKGVGLGRDSAIRSLSNVNINVESIKDVTGVPHGGVRPKKARRA